MDDGFTSFYVDIAFIWLLRLDVVKINEIKVFVEQFFIGSHHVSVGR